MAQVNRPLPYDLQEAIEQTYVRPFHLVRMDFDDGPIFLSSGPQVVLENQLLWSEDLSKTTPWARTEVTNPIPNWVVIDGVMSLSKLMANMVSTVTHHVQTPISADDHVRLSFGCYASKGDYDFARIEIGRKDGTTAYLSYQFSTGTTTTDDGGDTATDFRVEVLRNGLVRLVILGFSIGAGGSSAYARIALQNAEPHVAWAGTDNQGTHYGGAQVWFGTDLYPYVATTDSAYGQETFIAGLIDVGQFDWTPDGGQTGQIELFNEDNAAVALVLTNGVAEVPCTVYDCYLKSDRSPTAPVVTVKGVLTDSDISPTSAIVTVTTVKAGVEFQPNRYVTPAEGFNWLPPDGAQVTWGGELYIFERE